MTLGLKNYNDSVWTPGAVSGKTMSLNKHFNDGTTYGISLFNGGQNDPVNIVQPSIAMNYIIKI